GEVWAFISVHHTQWLPPTQRRTLVLYTLPPKRTKVSCMLPVLCEYREYLIGRGMSDNTVRAYVSHVERSRKWCATNNVDLCNMRPSQMRDLADQFKRSSAVRGQLRAALKHYWDLMDTTGPARAIDVPTPPRGQWRGLEDPWVVKLLAYARDDWPRGGVVYVGVYLGIRRTEIASLRWDAFDH